VKNIRKGVLLVASMSSYKHGDGQVLVPIIFKLLGSFRFDYDYDYAEQGRCEDFAFWGGGGEVRFTWIYQT
jgi:hypothetical protein